MSSLRATVTPAGVETVFTIHVADLEAAVSDLDDAHLTSIAREQTAVALGDNPPLPLLPDANVRVEHIGNNNLQTTVLFRFPGPVTGKRKVTITSRLIGRLPRGHREFVEVVTGPAGAGIGEGFLVASADRMSFELPVLSAPAPQPGIRFGQFFFLGVNHLLTGYDHLLFLGGLLIVCRSLLKAFQMLTLFTVAHSVTLTLVTLDVIKPSSALVEPMIAASIAYIGIENIFRPRADLSWRGVLTFCFGLVHGMGFAGALKELGVGTGGPNGVFQPLLYFSLGLETTQLGLAALVFPLLLWLRTKPGFVQVWVPACSAVIALAGLYWLVDRTLLGGT